MHNILKYYFQKYVRKLFSSEVFFSNLILLKNPKWVLLIFVKFKTKFYLSYLKSQSILSKEENPEICILGPMENTSLHGIS